MPANEIPTAVRPALFPKLIVANWKMNGLISNALPLVHGLVGQFRRTGADHLPEIVLCPPFHLLSTVADVLGHCGIRLGAQNAHQAENGAFTGEISSMQLMDIGCDAVILGHSERRQFFAEDDALIASKILAAHKAGLIVILCVGESEAEYLSGQRFDVVLRQLHAAIPAQAHSRNTIIAYEPVWAIGTGRTPTLEEIDAMHVKIRQSLGAPGQNARILYGGSVKAHNAAEILALPNVDGALVGGASLNLQEFWLIVQAAMPKPAREG